MCTFASICHEVIIQRYHDTFSSSDRRISHSGRLFLSCPFTWQPSIVIINSIHDRNYTANISFQLSGIKNYSRDVLLPSKTQTNRNWCPTQVMLMSSCVPHKNVHWNRFCFAGIRQTQSRDANWLWHENRIIIIHPLYQPSK